MKTEIIPRTFSWKQFLLFTIAALAISTFFHFGYHNIADPDSFYHAQQAEQYLSHPFDSASGWMRFSAIAQDRSDIWYGFHLVLAPFIALGGIDTGIRLAGVFLTTLFLLSLYYILRRHDAPLAWLWPFVAFFILPNATFFFVMTRPHMASLICALLLFSFLVRGGLWQVAVFAGLITWLHESFFWLPIFVFAAWFVGILAVHWRTKEKIDWRAVVSKKGWLILGTIIGMALRPEALGSAKLAWIQIVTLSRLNLAGIPIISGSELVPLGVTVFSTATIMLIVWVATIALGKYKFFKNTLESSEQIVLAAATMTLSAIFGLLSIFVAIRFFVLWIAFTIFALVIITKHWKWPRAHRVGILCFLVVVLIPYTLYRHNVNEKYVATPPEKFEAAALWLRDHSAPGDLVFNTHWDQFGPLVHWDTKNTYVGGMHSVFQYAYNPALYWKYYYISIDAAGEATCPLFPCSKEQVVATYDVLKNDFSARFIFVEPSRNPYFSEYLTKDKRFTLEYSDKEAEIFEIDH